MHRYIWVMFVEAWHMPAVLIRVRESIQELPVLRRTDMHKAISHKEFSVVTGSRKGGTACYLLACMH